MALENATYLNELDTAWPATGDQTAQGDDHIRLLKAVLKGTFPGLSGPFSRVIPKGASFTPALTENTCTFVSTAALTVNLAVPSGLPVGTFYRFKAVTGAITLQPSAGTTIEGAASLALPVGSHCFLAKQTDVLWAAFAVTPPPTPVPTFASGTKMIFAQAAAPTGWTQDTSDAAVNRMLRVVNTAGGGVGGSHSPILNNVVPAHTHAFSTGAVSSDHIHSGSTGGRSAAHVHSVTVPYALSGSGGSPLVTGSASTTANLSASVGAESADHSHGFSTGGISANHSHSGSTDNGSSQTSWAPRYLDLIVCTKS
jgi:hypothetical protein